MRKKKRFFLYFVSWNLIAWESPGKGCLLWPQGVQSDGRFVGWVQGDYKVSYTGKKVKFRP